MTDRYLEYAQNDPTYFIGSLLKNKDPLSRCDAIFMAGSPGAGKTEVSMTLAKLNSNYVIIDADYFRTKFPDYNGQNSNIFQKASSWLVEQAFKRVINEKYSFILDATFAVPSAEKKIVKSLKNDYQAIIFYVYQDPKIAWKFTKLRELNEGRKVSKDIFINSYFKARENVIKVKKRHPEVIVHVIIKDFENNISDIIYEVDNLEMILPQNYTRERLEEELDD